MNSASLDLDDDFLAMAVARSMLNAEDAVMLAREAKEQKTCGSVVAIQRGMLDAFQVDVLQILLRPEAAVPGYKILDFTGRGGMGVVFRVKQISLDREVALKMILANRLAEKGAAERFEHEARSVARLSHPHIVTAYDFGRVDGRVYLAMEYLVGEDLEHFLGKVGRLVRTVAWGIARQAASGLAHAARLGIVHRDVKPANLFLTQRPEGFHLEAGLPMVKITDFGLAFLMEASDDRTRLTADGQAMGTPSYLAPEQLTGKHVDHRADVYALGATIYQTLTGQLPYAGRTAYQVISAKASGEPLDLAPLRPYAGADDVQLIADMTAFDPLLRPADYAQLLLRIDNLTQQNATAAATSTLTLSTQGSTIAFPIVDQIPTTTSGVRRITRTISRRAMATGLAGLSGLLGLGGGMWWLRSRTSTFEELQEVREFPLFDEKSLDDWRILQGSWSIVQDDEKESVIHGSGWMERSLPTAEGRLPECYRIVAGVELLRSTAVELRFAFMGPSKEQPTSWFSLRVASKEGAWLTATRPGSDARTESAILPLPIRPTEGSSFREMRVDRHPDHWYAFLDGVLIGKLSTRTDETLPIFQLYVEGLDAQFADLQFDVLRPPGQ